MLRTKIIILLGCISLLFWGCNKESYLEGIGYPTTNNNLSTSGQVCIWRSQDGGWGIISVYIDGNYAGDLSSYYSSGSGSCGDNDNATISQTLSIGTHTAYANSSTGASWNTINFDITPGGCYKIEL